MHEGREVEVMRRRGIATVMDTSEEGDEDEEEVNGEMAGVVFTGASIQQQQQTQSALNVSFPRLSRIALHLSEPVFLLHEFSLGKLGKRENDLVANRHYRFCQLS